MKRYTRFRDIPQYIQDGNYVIDCGLDYLERGLYSFYMPGAHGNDPPGVEKGFELPVPDFQRAHVWTTRQREAFVIHLLKGGDGGIIRFNASNWPQVTEDHPLEVVDGLQRLTACLMFVQDKLRVYGSLFSEYEDRIRTVSCRLKLQVNNLRTRREVLNWYLQLNAGGTPHTKKELDRVRDMLEAAPFRSIRQVEDEYLPSLARKRPAPNRDEKVVEK